MADLNDILTGLRAELVKTVLQITVDERGDGEASFEYVPTGKGALKPGRVRSFSVRLASCESKWCGCGVSRFDTAWEIRIGYPAQDWEIAIASDFGQVRAAINSNGAFSAVDGVAFHHVPLSAPALERGEEWCYATIGVNATVEADAPSKTMPNYQIKTVTAVTVAGSPVTLYTFTPTADGGGSWSYHVQSSDCKTARAGLIAASWDVASSSAVHYDESTSDIAATGAAYPDTSGLVFNVSVAAGAVVLAATSTDDTWTVRTTELSRS